ncbi:MAG: hypothetical protein PHW60_12265 [Kiritimatiellae bacterium]|nr:hypothetical protein [Kiritimatiellia bacterium]
MRFFDANCFLGRPASPTLSHFESAPELLAEMDDIGIERSVVWHADALASGIAGNRRLMREIKRRPRLEPAWLVNPRALSSPRDTSEYLKELSGANVRVVRFQPGPLHNFSLHHWAYREFFEGLAGRGIILYVDFQMTPALSHAAVPEYEWPILHDLATNIPELNIILFAPKLSSAVTQTMGLLRACRNVMLDISALQKWRATELVCENCGAGQLLFGGYMPYFDAAQFVVQLQCALIPDADKQKIAFDNLASKLGVK